MSDIFSAIDTGLSSNIDKKVLSKHKVFSSPFLTNNEEINSGDTFFVLDIPLTQRDLTYLKKVITNSNIGNYHILYGLQIALEGKDWDTYVSKQYIETAIDFSKYIPKWSKIISFGRSIFSLTQCDDLDCSFVGVDADKKSIEKFPIINGFYDTILWKTSFFHPDLKCQIFPVDSWKDLISKDTGLFKDSFEYWFMNKQLSICSKFKLDPYKYRAIKSLKIDNPNEWLLKHTDNKETIGFDCETNSLDPWSNQAKVTCITLCFESDPYTGYYLSAEDLDPNILSNFLKDRNLIGSYLKFDCKFMNLKLNIPLDHFKIFGDTLQLQHICNEMLRKGLKSSAWLWTPYGGYDKDLDTYIKNNPICKKDYSKIPEDVIIPYASKDPCISVLAHKELLSYMNSLDDKLNKANPYGYSLSYCYSNIIIPTLNMFSDIELEGMTIDKKILKEKSIEIKTQIYSLESAILLELGETRESINLESNLFDDFEKLESGLIEGSDITDWGTIGIRGSKEINKSFKLGSSDQLGKKLEILGWDIKSRNIKGLPNTGVDQLTEWAKQGRTLATKLLKYRELCKMLSTYIGIEEKKSGMYKWIRDDGKIHSLYNNFGALSWRHTSSQPNGQNWVSHGEKAEVIRSFITPKNNPLYGFSSTDFSGLQLRLIGMVSNDSEMVTTFKVKGGDLHIRTAFNIFLKYLMGIETLEDAVELKEIKDDTGKLIKDYRFKSKSANFGFVFGASALTALTTTIKPNWSKDDALKYVIANGLESEANNYYQRIISGKIKQLQKSQDKDENYTTSLYCAVANDVRTKFFETYTGLADWIDLTREEAKLKGYVQSVYGSIRRLPYLLINHEDADINRGYFHGLLNVCLNSPIQTMESIIMNRSLLIIWRWIKDNKLEHKIFGQIHDAMEFFSLLTDKQALINKIHEVCETDYPEYKGLLLEVESNISDYYGKNELWDMGKNIASTVE